MDEFSFSVYSRINKRTQTKSEKVERCSRSDNYSLPFELDMELTPERYGSEHGETRESNCRPVERWLMQDNPMTIAFD
jgi:hypothetical protein